MKHTRTLAVAIAIIGIALLFVGLIAPVILQTNAPTPSIGIIGGADGPTYLFTLKAVAGGLFLWMAIVGALMTVTSVVLLIAGRKKK